MSKKILVVDDEADSRVLIQHILEHKTFVDLLGDLREGWLEELELLILQAGLAMEKDLLVKRIEHYENLRRQD